MVMDKMVTNINMEDKSSRLGLTSHTKELLIAKYKKVEVNTDIRICNNCKLLVD